MSLVDDMAEEALSNQDVMVTNIVLIAYLVNHESELKRCHRWFMQTGAIDEGIALDEYRAHLQTTLTYLLRDYEEYRIMLETADRLGHKDARMTPAMAQGPVRVPSPGKESRNRGTDARPAGRRDDAYLFVV